MEGGKKWKTIWLEAAWYNFPRGRLKHADRSSLLHSKIFFCRRNWMVVQKLKENKC